MKKRIQYMMAMVWCVENPYAVCKETIGNFMAKRQGTIDQFLKRHFLQNSLLLTVYFLLCISLTHAQRYPVQVTQTIIPPYTTKLSDYTSASDVKLRLHLLLTDVVANNKQVRLKLRIQGNGLDIRSVDFVHGASPIFLNGGVSNQYTNIDLSSYFEPNNLIGITPRQYQKSLPEGVYTFCWEVYDAFTNEQLNHPTLGCSNIYLLLNDPPFLNVPYKGDQVVAQDPMNIIFQWTPRHANASNVSYEFELRELWDTQIAPEAAFLTSPNYYTETTYTTTLFYNIGKPPLLPNKRYGWRIKAKSITGISENAIFKNDGYSEIYYFTYSGACYPPMYVLSEAVGKDRIKLTWQGAPEHKKYHVQYKRADIPDAEWFEVYTYNTQAQISNLRAGKTYVFRVGGSCNDLNDFNPLYSYSTTSQFTLPTKDEMGSSYTCGIVPEIKITNTDPLPNIGVNETFTAGDFPVTVKQVEGGNGSFTGVGYIVVPYLGDTKIAVRFDNIRINTDYQLIEGVVSTTYDTTWGDVESVDEVVEDMEDLIVAVFSTTDRIKNKAEELQNNGSISEEEKNKIDTDRLVIEAAAVALENEKAAAAELQELAENEKDADKKKELQEQAKEKLEDIKKDAEKVKEAADNLERKLGIGKDKDITIGKDGYFDGTIKLSDVKNPKNSIITDGKDINNAPKLFSSVKYAKENRILNRHLGDKKKLVITNSEVTQKEIDSLKKIVANPGKDHLLWVHYDLKTQEIKYKISFTNTFFGELRILREEYVKLYNNILTANIKASIGAAIINASEHLDLLLEEYKDHISFVNQELIAGRTTYDVLKSILSFTKKCAGDFKSQQKGIVPKCLWNDNDHLAMAYYAGFIDAAWEGGEMIVALYKFKAAWDPLDSFFLNAEAFKIRQQTIDIVLLIRQLDKEDSLVSSVTSTIKKEFVKYVDETLALDPQARYNQGKLIFDIASFFIGYGEVKAFLKTGKITSATFKSLRKIPSTLQKTIVGFGKFGKKLLVKIDHVTGEVLIKGQKIARLNKEKLTLYVKALSESIDDNLQPVGQLITPEGYLVKLDDGRSISDRVFNIIGDTNGKYKVAVAKLADVGGDLLSGLKTKLANKLDDTQWKKFEVDFGNNTDLLKKFDENPELVDSWKVISNSPHSTDLDFIKFFDDVDVVSARNIVANNSAMRSKFPDMSVEELTAIYHYTTDAYHDLNRALRGLDPMTDQLDAFNKALSNSMDKLPKYTNTTYRGSPVPESVLNNYKNTFDNKTNVIEDAFTSTSKESNVAVSFADDVIKDGDVRVFFTVEGKNGVDIEDISAYGPSFDPSYSESEILFKSGLEFKVSNFEDTFDGSGNRLVLITLTE